MPPVTGASWHHIWRSGYNETSGLGPAIAVARAVLSAITKETD